MAHADWTFHTRDTGPTATFSTFIDFSTPFVGAGSLVIDATGLPNESTVAAHPVIDATDAGFSSGRIQTILEKKTGSGFREHGVYFLSNNHNPLVDGAACYSVIVCDGATSVRIQKNSDGIHGLNPGTSTLQTYSDSPSIPIPNVTAPSVLRVDWFAGGLVDLYGGTRIVVSFWHNSTDFNDLMSFTEFIDADTPLTAGVSEGIFTRSRSSSEVVNGKFDNTSIYKRNTI